MKPTRSAAAQQQLDAAWEHVSAGNVRAAIDLLTDVIEATPGDATALAHRGRAHRLRGRWRQAIADFDASLALRPGAPAVLFLRGCTRARIGRARAAIADLVRSTEILPDQADAHRELGVLYAWNGDAENSIARYRRALALEPEVYAGLADTIAEIERDGLVDGDQSHSEDVLARIEEATAFEAAGDLDAAIDVLTAAAVAHPTDAYPLECRALIHLRQQQWRRAAADCDAVLALSPDGPTTLFRRGVCRARLGETHAAIEDLVHSTDLLPWNAAAQFELGALLALAGEPAQAIARYQRAFELEPDEYPDAPAWIADLAQQLPS